jgi:drug/metabolite transporter (DMT)-like permease
MATTQERASREIQARPSLDLDAFTSTDWLLLIGTAFTWGSSFVWIEIGLESFEPALIALLRIMFGALTLVMFSKARAPVERADLRIMALLGLLWMAAPFLLFPIAQQWIDSSLAGMINGGVPIFAGVVAALMLRRLPPAKTLVGIAIGFIGVVVLSLPAVQESRASALGVALVVLATAFYGISINIAVPLQKKYGALPVLLRAQMFALGFTLIPGIIGATDSSFDWASFGAMIPLGCLGTGLAFVGLTTLVGRVGAARGSVTIYFLPVIAIALGAIFRDEDIALISLAGAALVIAGAFLASRTQAARH